MGRYVQIDTDVLKEHLNQQLGKLHGMIKNNWRQALKVLIRKFKQRAIDVAIGVVLQKLSPSLCEKTSDIAKGVEQTNEFMKVFPDL